MRKLLLIITMLTCLFPMTVLAIENVSMKVGETKTLYLPSSVTSNRLRGVNFLSYGYDCVEVLSYTDYSVKIKAIKKTPSAGVIVRCNYTYYMLRNGTYVYGGIGAYDWNVKVTGIDPTSISLPEEIQLERGQSMVLQPTLSPSNATTELTWESSAYATVNVWQTGKILAQQNGASIITVSTSNGKKAQCKVTVGPKEIAATSINITSNITSINLGSIDILSATVLPADATNKSVTWSSSNPSVISVDATSGIISGRSVGYATITARTNNGLSCSKRIECKDNVPVITLYDNIGISGTLPSVAHVNYERKFRKGWNTMCVPFPVTTALLNNTPQGLRIAVVKEVEVEGDRRNIVLQSVDKVGAGQPCLIHATTDVTWTVSLKSASLVSTPQKSSGIIGSFNKATIGIGFMKIADDGTTYSKTKTKSAVVHPFRCYFNE